MGHNRPQEKLMQLSTCNFRYGLTAVCNASKNKNNHMIFKEFCLFKSHLGSAHLGFGG